MEDVNDAVGVYFNRDWKSWASVGANLVVIVRPELPFVVNALMLVLWAVPERRIERAVRS